MHGVTRLSLSVAILILLLAGLSGCQGNAPAVSPAPARPAPAVQPTATVPPATSTPAGARSGRAGSLSYTADVRARTQVNVVPKIGGRIDEVKVDIGDRVKAGDMLVVLEHKMLDAQVKQAEAGLAAAQATLAKMQAGPRQEQVAAAQANVQAAQARYDLLKKTPFTDQVKTAEENVDRAKNALWQAQSQRDAICANKDGVWQAVPSATGVRGMLVAPGGNCTAAEAGIGQAQAGVDLAQTQLDQVKAGPRKEDLSAAAAAVNAARQSYELTKAPFTDTDFAPVQAQIAGAEAAVELAKLTLDESFIRAPIDGIVASKPAVVGMMVGSGTAPGSTPLVVLVSQDVQIVFGVEDSQIRRVTVGQVATLSVAAYPEETFTGKVAIISPVADPVARTFEVTVYPDDPDHKLRPGMFADIALEAVP